MRIQSSSVAMALANRNYRSLSRRSGSFFGELKDFDRSEKDENEQTGSGRFLISERKGSVPERRLLSDHINSISMPEMSPSDELRLRTALFREMLDVILHGAGRTNRMRGNLAGVQGGGIGVWKRMVYAETIIEEHQETAFESSGVVRTADGRQISFGVKFSMSRSMSQRFSATASMPYILTDPLVINLSDSVTRVSDRTFHFDLDCDGEKEEIHFAGEGSGFLALDRNGDGEINDGSELFGTSGGDGFKDLAGYDSDANGWIDENDEVFGKLRVWTKDGDGGDVLLDLKQSDVGAIYLGNVDTRFSLYSDDGYAGELQKSGVYLRESSGAAGTLSHVDLASMQRSDY